MRRNIVLPIVATASLLGGCGGDGYGDTIEKCRTATATDVAIDVAELEDLAQSSVWWIKDPTTDRGFWSDENLDPADKQGELACINSEDKLVLTVAGLALANSLPTQE